MRPLIVEPEAELELAEAIDWYEAQRPGLGGALLDDVTGVLSQVLRREVVTLQVPGVRADLPVRRVILEEFPYSVVFVDTDDHLVVVAFAHHRRRAAYWAHRLPKR